MALKDLITWFTGGNDSDANSPDTWGKPRPAERRRGAGRQVTEWHSSSKGSVPDAGAEAFFDDARRQIDRMREEFWTNKDNLRELLRSPGARMPALDDTKVEETPTEYHVTLELSGFAKDEVQLHLRGDRMTVVCEQRKSREGEAGDGSSREMFYNRLERVVPFAVAVDHTKIKSTFTDGVLRVTLFKAPR